MDRLSPTWRRVLVAVAAAAVAVIAALALIGGTSGGNVRTFCDTVRAGEDPLVLFGAYKPGDLEMGNPQLDKAVDRLRRLYESSPTQIEESLKTLLDAAEEIAVALKARAPGASSGTIPSQLPTVELDEESLRQAAQVVMSFAQEKCSVALGTPTTTTTIPAPAPPP